MRQIDGAVAGVIDWHGTDVLYFLFAFVVPVDEPFIVRVDDVPVPWIRQDEAAFTAAGFKPILPTNHSGVRAARNADIRIVLLRTVNVIGERIVHSDMIKLRSRLVVLSGPIFAAIC